MPKIDPKKLAKRFRDRNRRFLALNVHKQRLKILKDVISLLESKKIVALSDNTYLSLAHYKRPGSYSLDEQVHTILEQNKCEVCGVGSIFASAVSLKNKLKIKDLVDKDIEHVRREEMVKYLRKWFSASQLNLIEMAFESDKLSIPAYTTKEFDARDFGRNYKSDTTRLKAICRNMIENNGKFVPQARRRRIL